MRTFIWLCSKHHVPVLLLLLIAATPAVTFAQSPEQQGAAVAPPQVTEEDAAAREALEQEVGQALALVAETRDTLQRLNTERAKLDGVLRKMLDTRVAQTLDRLVASTNAAAETFLRERAEPVDDADPLRLQIVEVVTSIPEMIKAEIANVRKGLDLPSADQTALQQAAMVADLEIMAREEDALIDKLIANNELAARLGLDTQSSEAALRRQIVAGTENASAYLDVTMKNLDKLRRQLTTLPKNEELVAKIAVTEKHITTVSDIVRKRARRMASFGYDVSWIEAQLIAATGALTTEILNWSVITRLTSDFFNGISNWLADNGARIVFQMLVFVAILVIAWKLAKLAQIFTQRALRSTRVRLSQLLQGMIVSTARSIVLVLGLLIGLSQLGVSLGPLLAGLGIAGFIVGFALQDSLANFASGMMILIYRPFDIGDTVDVNGAFGTVRQMSLVNTTILTYDNQTLVVPNNQVWQNVIKNLTNQKTRRVDMTFGISYADDIEKAERVLRDIVRDNDKVLDDPAPLIHLHELGDSSVNFIVRPWVRTEDYWDTYWSITRAVKMRFDAEGITIPFPQRDVHLHTRADGGAS